MHLFPLYWRLWSMLFSPSPPLSLYLILSPEIIIHKWPPTSISGLITSADSLKNWKRLLTYLLAPDLVKINHSSSMLQDFPWIIGTIQSDKQNSLYNLSNISIAKSHHLHLSPCPDTQVHTEFITIAHSLLPNIPTVRNSLLLHLFGISYSPLKHPLLCSASFSPWRHCA